MAGSWLLAASVAVHFIPVRAQGKLAILTSEALLTHLDHLGQQQVTSSAPAFGSLTTSLTPVATICPSSQSFGKGSTQNANFHTTSATVRLPGGGSTVFATRVRRQSNQSGAATDGTDAAHLISGTDGCSTLFTPTTFSACSTVVSPLGLPPVTVTECDQYITFSSETLFMCPPTPTITPKPASSLLSNRIAISLTQRPNLSQNDTFMNASTTYIPGAESKNIQLASSTRSYSGAAGMPMSVPRQWHAGKREAMFDRNGRYLDPRQLLFHSKGGVATTDLVILAPSTTIIEKEAMLTNAPVRAIDTGSFTPPDQTVTGIVAPVVTTLMPIPDVPKANDVTTGQPASTIRTGFLRLRDLGAIFHKSHTNKKRSAEVSSLPLSITHTNSTRLSLKLAKLETIRIANANAAAREAQIPGVQNLSPPSPTKFYATPWSEIITGGVPEHVLGITCYGGGEHVGKCTEPDSDGDPEECECVTERQSWSIRSFTETRVGTTVVSYNGPLVITGAGGALTTTNTQFLSTMETTRSFVDSFVTKKTLTGEETVTRTMTSVPSATVSVLPVGDVKAAAPQGAPESVAGVQMAVMSASDEATTVQVTSYVATETVTIPPAEETDDVAGSETVPSTAIDGAVDATNAKRDDDGDWPSDVWMIK